ncbi:DUF1631 family protein [Undibacterium jejuense]|uniref:DUF1631 family protein n=1 Tax=Undibacterium jejuense TaxID=1344949 RepID=A0A923HHY9_9BURK|nr:DUF1631 family protein [Undibacterium jejuense]MBC3861094.1 DUF1631 family protein [Undibacterium jejuense]
MSHSKITSSELAGAVIPRPEMLRGLTPLASHLTIAQVDAFSARLANALLAYSEQSMDSRIANLSFNAGQLLKKNAYAFYHIASVELEKVFKHETELLLTAGDIKKAVETKDGDFSLVSYEEMDQKLTLSRVSRAIELDSAEQYAALNMRLSHLLDRETLSIAQNPFRPEVFLRALYVAWCAFDPEESSRELILPLLRVDILFDLEPILLELNQWLINKGVLPDLQESYRIQRKQSKSHVVEKEDDAQVDSTNEFGEESSSNQNPVRRKLKAFLSGGRGKKHRSGHPSSSHSGANHQSSDYGVPGSTDDAINSALFRQLGEFQKSVKFQQLMSEAQDVMRLSQMREHLSESMGTGVEKHTLDLLSQVFDSVFRNQDIPAHVKELISVLQIPVLKAALIDKEFFFQEQHPARRLIDLLSRYSPALDKTKGKQDPLYQTMQKNVQRVSQEFDQEITLFDEVVNDLESFIAKEEQASAQALEAPIQKALRKEKIKQANITATHEVAIRVGSGEVVAFIETFLENRWTKVLTLAYTVQEEKPHAVVDAIKTMDDLIWSVKPKITLQERQELLNRLPAILARLNKWLSLIKWEDVDRVQFFADLAECHASIVRAPLELSPERQVEIAVEAAQKAAERRLEKRVAAEQAAASAPPPISEEYVTTVSQLERGIWLEFIKENDEALRVRLAWVSPMRSLYIFTSSEKEKSFSIGAPELEKVFSEQRAKILVLDKVVDRALLEALDHIPDENSDSIESADTMNDAETTA